MAWVTWLWGIPDGRFVELRGMKYNPVPTLSAMAWNHGPPPPPRPSPALVLPHWVVGDRHLLNPKFFVAAHCVVVAKPPPKSAAQSIPVESGEHVQEFKVKWSRTKKILHRVGQ